MYLSHHKRGSDKCKESHVIINCTYLSVYDFITKWSFEILNVDRYALVLRLRLFFCSCNSCFVLTSLLHLYSILCLFKIVIHFMIWNFKTLDTNQLNIFDYFPRSTLFFMDREVTWLNLTTTCYHDI